LKSPKERECRKEKKRRDEPIQVTIHIHENVRRKPRYRYHNPTKV
jgi:hypothetical protein